MSDDASFDPRFAPEFQRGFPQADGVRDASRTSPYAPGRSGAQSGSPAASASARPDSTPTTASGLGERRRARGGAAARELPGRRTEARSLIGMPPEEAARLSPYAAADSTGSSASTSSSAQVPTGGGATAPHAPSLGRPAGGGALAASAPAATSVEAEAHTGGTSAPTSARRRISPWRNPWLYVLFAAGSVLTIAGVSLTRWSLFMMYSPLAGSQSASDQPIDYTGVQVAWILGPTLVIVGGATLMGALFFVAASWLAARPLLVDATDDAALDADFTHDDDAWNGTSATFVPFDQSGSSANSRDR
ncbi:hypothetical protein ALI44B_07335 [Leifsonia sp. ALI-44-B]|jgi:hypothetical protein|uniref:hypothetical protein n=1 Tax=Leifsonia sp. ALI-44-B TaxID=1933776 RepID=UPI00097C4279|nr:hypothetical protein [Leifsonia sp. ALI-44-B]ONI60438.1 hypothetical protein ALI44B_07335 [Leifsonia sp. ALI-44-B]